MPSHRSETLPNLQLAWDQTSLGSLLFCPRRYQYEHLWNFIPKHEAVELTFGRYYHDAMEVYDKAMALGEKHADAMDATLIKVWELCSIFDSQDRYRNPETLLRTVVWYMDKWKDDTAKTIVLPNGKPAVELSFSYELDLISPDGVPYLMCGHFDGIVLYADEGLMVKERKTTKATLADNYFQQFSPNLQVTWYFVAANIVLDPKYRPKNVLIDSAQVAVGFSDFRRAFAPRLTAHVQEFLREVKLWIKSAERYAEEDYSPKNERNCFLCAFKKVCSAAPSVRKAHLEADFVRREWNPLEPR